jgi:DNA-binding transcriptional LysR family regulator
MDLDLRKVRYFVAVAEHVNFGRAAQALHIAQPVLSRQIRALEDNLKVSLFERDTRGTRLTAAGEALLEEARALLPAADAARQRVREAALGKRTFTVGFSPGIPIAPAVRELSRRHPEVSVEVVHNACARQADIIRDGRVDIGYLRLPADIRGLSVERLFTEPLVAMLPADHSLAGKEAVSAADLVGERLLQDPENTQERRESGLGPLEGQPGQALPAARTAEEKLELIAAGHGIVVVPLSTAAFYARPDVTYVPVEDIPACHVCLAWESSRRGLLLSEYVTLARRAA